MGLAGGSGGGVGMAELRLRMGFLSFPFVVSLFFLKGFAVNQHKIPPEHPLCAAVGDTSWRSPPTSTLSSPCHQYGDETGYHCSANPCVVGPCSHGERNLPKETLLRVPPWNHPPQPPLEAQCGRAASPRACHLPGSGSWDAAPPSQTTAAGKEGFALDLCSL